MKRFIEKAPSHKFPLKFHSGESVITFADPQNYHNKSQMSALANNFDNFPSIEILKPRAFVKFSIRLVFLTNFDNDADHGNVSFKKLYSKFTFINKITL